MHCFTYIRFWTEPGILLFRIFVSKHPSKIQTWRRGEMWAVLYGKRCNPQTKWSMQIPCKRVSPSFNGSPLPSILSLSVWLVTLWSSVILICFPSTLPQLNIFSINYGVAGTNHNGTSHFKWYHVNNINRKAKSIKQVKRELQVWRKAVVEIM